MPIVILTPATRVASAELLPALEAAEVEVALACATVTPALYNDAFVMFRRLMRHVHSFDGVISVDRDAVAEMRRDQQTFALIADRLQGVVAGVPLGELAEAQLLAARWGEELQRAASLTADTVANTRPLNGAAPEAPSLVDGVVGAVARVGDIVMRGAMAPQSTWEDAPAVLPSASSEPSAPSDPARGSRSGWRSLLDQMRSGRAGGPSTDRPRRGPRA